MKIAALLPTHQHITDKKKRNRINVKNYFGLKIIVNEIKLKLGYDVEYIDYSRVKEFDIILFSLHSISDYYALVYTIEKKLKGKRSGVWICGGAGVVNINLLIDYFDYIVLGRGEELIIELLNNVRNKKIIKHESIVVGSHYHSSRIYKINYTQKLYVDSKAGLIEQMYGCKYNCYYCNYRYTALPPNLREEDNKTTMPGNEETFWDLEIKNGSFYTTSLDGLTEEIRYKVNKPISNKMIIEKIVKASKITNIINLKLYLIIGYPGEKELNLKELYNVFNEINKKVDKCKIFIKLHFTPFAASPSTPMQWEKVDIINDYREKIEELRQTNKYMYEGNSVRVLYMRTTIMPIELLKRMVYYRGGLEDMDLIKYIATSRAVISHSINNKTKLSNIKKQYNLNKFTSQYPVGTQLESSNIKSWQSDEMIIKQANLYRK